MNKFVKIITLLLILAFLCGITVHRNAFSLVGLQVTSPQDETITEQTRLMVTGAASDAKELSINGKNVELEKRGKFSALAILQPGKNVISVTAVFSEGQTLTKNVKVLRIISFEDLKKLYKGKPHWAKSQIVSLSTLRVVEGFPDNTFGPSKSLSRGELATWLSRAAGLDTPKPTEDVFFDVPKEHWRAKYIKAVVDVGFMKGLRENEFGINDKLKRAEALEVIAKAYNLQPAPVTNQSPFLDVQSSTINSDFIYAAYNLGLINGVSKKEKVFEPERDMKRAEVVVLLSRIKRMKDLTFALYNFNEGYTAAKRCIIDTRPKILNASAYPKRLVANGKIPLKLSAEVDDVQGKSDISLVWADLSGLGGPNNAKMNPVGKGLYELSFIVSSETEAGAKYVVIKASDKSGLKTSKTVMFTLQENK